MKDGLARLGKVIDHAIDKFIGIILETRKGYNQTVFLYNASGDDSVPCKNDKVIILKIDGTGNFIGAGVLIESKGAKPGEKIFFGRDADGNVVSKLSMLNDGSINLKNDGDVTTETKGDHKEKIEGDKVETIKGKFFFGNDAQNTCKLWLGIIDEIEQLETFGPPPQHKVKPTTIQRLEAYKNQVKALYKDGA
jgi:hypothetical protein